MFCARRIRQCTIAWVAMVALVGGILGSPFAHPLALDIGGANSDMCVSSGSGVVAKPMAPGGRGHAVHVNDCPCCTGSPPGIASLIPHPIALPVDDRRAAAIPSRNDVRPQPPTTRVGLARAPPLPA